MSKQSSVSSLLAAAASFLLIGMVAVGSASPASAASEEDLAAPHGSFVSTMAIPGERGNNVRVGALSEDDAVNYDELSLATYRERIAAMVE